MNRRSRARFLILVMATSLVTTCSLAVEPGKIPPIYYANLEFISKDYPIWVEAEAAFGPDGEFIETLFHPVALAPLRDFLSTPPGPEKDCFDFGPRFESWVDPPDRSSLSQALEHSQLVLFGTIVDKAFGFDRGLPGQLLVVEPSKTLKSEVHLDFYMFFIPVGSFEAGPYKFCQNDFRYAEPPEIGERVVLMIPKVYDPAEPYLNLVYETSLISLSKDGEVHLPQEFRLSETKAARETSGEGLLAEISALLGEKDHEP